MTQIIPSSKVDFNSKINTVYSYVSRGARLSSTTMQPHPTMTAVIRKEKLQQCNGEVDFPHAMGRLNMPGGTREKPCF